MIFQIGVYICYTSFTIFQESLYRIVDKDIGADFTSTSFLLLCICSTNLFAAILASRFYRIFFRIFDVRTISASFCYILSMFFASKSLQFIPFPFYLLAKSVKMIPVNYLGYLARGKSYSLQEGAAVLLIAIGLNIYKSSVSGDEKRCLLGIVLVVISLMFDGAAASQIDKLKQNFQMTAVELMYHCNTWAIILLLPIAYVTEEFKDGVYFCWRNSQAIYFTIGASISSAIGQLFIFRILANSNSFNLSIITTTRKFIRFLYHIFISIIQNFDYIFTM